MPHPNLINWAQAHPETLELLDQLSGKGIPYGIISGLVAVAHGTRLSTNDTDLFTPPSHFDALTNLLPEPHMVAAKEVVMHDYRGQVIRFVASEATAMLDGTDIQVMRPLSPVQIGGRAYSMEHTELVTRSLIMRSILGKRVSFTHTADTIIMKSLFQRGAGKSDFPDAQQLARYCSPEDVYLWDRAEEIGFGVREYNFLGKIGLATAARRPLLALAA